MAEKWKIITDFHAYEISNLGRIRKKFTQKGVRKVCQKYRADIKVNGNIKYLGTFVAKQDAIEAFNNAYKEYHGIHPYDKVLKPWNDRHGYCLVDLTQDGKGKTYLIHVLVAQEFIGLRPSKMTINHKDGIKSNNSTDNLEYISLKDNAKHAIDNNLYQKARGSAIGNSKLTESDVKNIRHLYNDGKHTQRQLSDMFNIRENYVYRIIKRHAWSWL